MILLSAFEAVGFVMPSVNKEGAVMLRTLWGVAALHAFGDVLCLGRLLPVMEAEESPQHPETLPWFLIVHSGFPFGLPSYQGVLR
jgi:hypothetical protein